MKSSFPQNMLRPPPLGTFPYPIGFSSNSMNSKDEWDVACLLLIFRGFPQTQTTTLLGYFYMLGCESYTIHHIYHIHQLHHFFLIKKNWDSSFPPQQKSPQVVTENSSSTLRPYASESWRLSKIPSVPMSTTSPSSTSEATHHGSPIRCSTGLHKKRGVFKHGDVNIFLSKRLINVEMVSELLVVHLSQNEAYLLHDSDSSPKKNVWLRKESSQLTTLQ